MLNHKPYRLLGALLPRLSRFDADLLTSDPGRISRTLRNHLNLLLDCAEAYVWAGFLSHPFFDQCAELLVLPREPSSPNQDTHEGSESHNICQSIHDRKRLPQGTCCALSACDTATLMKAVRVFGALQHVSRMLFDQVSHILESRWKVLSPQDVTSIAVAFSTPLRPAEGAIRVLSQVAGHLEVNIDSYEYQNIAKCLAAFKALNVFFPSCIEAGCERLARHVTMGYNVRQHCAISVPALCDMMEASAHFGSAFSKSNLSVTKAASDFCSVTLMYLEDHIDEIGEKGAMQALFAMSALSDLCGE